MKNLTIANKNEESIKKDIVNSKKEAMLSLVVFAVPAIFFNFQFIIMGDKAVPWVTYQLDDVIHNWRLFGILFMIPVFLFLVIRKNRLDSVGIKKKNFFPNISIGLFIIAILMWFNLGSLLIIISGLGVICFWGIQHYKFKQRENIELKKDVSNQDVILGSPRESNSSYSIIELFHLRIIIPLITSVELVLFLIGPRFRNGYDPMREAIWFSWLFLTILAYSVIIFRIVSSKYKDVNINSRRVKLFDNITKNPFFFIPALILGILTPLSFLFGLGFIPILLSFLLFMTGLITLDIYLISDYFNQKIIRYQEKRKPGSIDNINMNKNHNNLMELNSRFFIILFLLSLPSILLYIILKGFIRTGEPLLSYSGFYGVLTCLAIGVGEELLYRGLLQNRFVTWLGEKRGLFLTAGLFALSHVPMAIVSFSGNNSSPISLIFYVVYLFMSSMSLGYLALKTENITGCILIHTFLDLL